MIFNQIVFEEISTEEMYKSNVNGMADKTISNFNFVTISSLYKSEVKQTESQIEFIQSYLESAKALVIKLKEQDGAGGGIHKIFYNYSLTLPIIYLCRHCLELAIKCAISRKDGRPKETHGLDKLWSSFCSCLTREQSDQEQIVLKAMRAFVEDINKLDETGTKLRYPLNKDGTCTQENILWANSERIVDGTEKFVKQLNELSIN